MGELNNLSYVIEEISEENYKVSIYKINQAKLEHEKDLYVPKGTNLQKLLEKLSS